MYRQSVITGYANSNQQSNDLIEHTKNYSYQMPTYELWLIYRLINETILEGVTALVLAYSVIRFWPFAVATGTWMFDDNANTWVWFQKTHTNGLILCQFK